jgi:hypothetical protein
MMNNITYGTFLFFGCSLVVAMLVVILFMPETKGLSLEEMDILFSVSGLAYNKRAKADEVIGQMRAAEAVVGQVAGKGDSDQVETVRVV